MAKMSKGDWIVHKMSEGQQVDQTSMGRDNLIFLRKKIQQNLSFKPTYTKIENFRNLLGQH